MVFTSAVFSLDVYPHGTRPVSYPFVASALPGLPKETRWSCPSASLVTFSSSFRACSKSDMPGSWHWGLSSWVPLSYTRTSVLYSIYYIVCKYILYLIYIYILLLLLLYYIILYYIILYIIIYYYIILYYIILYYITFYYITLYCIILDIRY